VKMLFVICNGSGDAACESRARARNVSLFIPRLHPPQRQCPSQQGAGAGKSGDSEKRGTERLADLRMNDILPGWRQTGDDLGSVLDDAVEQTGGIAVGS